LRGSGAQMNSEGTMIGLCMIVKNESRVILRCLESVGPLVDYVLVEDTGSTDGTQKIVREWLDRTGRAGEVVEEPWRDFAYNRSHALARLRENKDVDYALMIDADDQVVIDAGFDAGAFKRGLSKDVYEVQLRNGLVHYQRNQMCNNRREFRYRGVLHEYLEGPPGDVSSGTAAGFHILSGREGARSQDPQKYRKDAEVLEQALQTEQDAFLRSRYTFYLGQSYRDSGEKEKALENYLRRAELGYWVDEVFMSLYRAGQLQQALKRPVDEVVATYLRASAAAPHRAEALHAASVLCRINNKFADAYEYARRGLKIAPPAGGLFVEAWVYAYGLLDELAVSAYWLERYQDCLAACQRLFSEGKMPLHMHARIRNNAEFAAKKIGFRGAAPAPGDGEAATRAKESGAATGIVRVENEAGQWKTVTLDAAAPCWQVGAFALPGYIHTAALQEIVEAIFYGLRQLDYRVELVTDVSRLSGRSILIGAHLLDEGSCAQVPPTAIVYNSEHAASNFMQPHYLGLLRRSLVWDYSIDNARALNDRLRHPALHVPLGYVPQFTRVGKQPEDIDVLFIGSHCPRRTVALDELRNRGVVVHHAFGVYGRDRDALVARSKVVLNLHQLMPGAFEVVRIAYLLANKKAVVSEVNAGETVDADLAGGFLGVPYEQIADAAVALARDPEGRMALEQSGFRKFSARGEAVILREALEQVGKA